MVRGRGRPAGNGKTPGSGRKKGSKNKRTLAATISVKEALVESFVQIGGVPALVEWGKLNLSDYYKIWSRMLPTEIKTPEGEAFVMKVLDLTGDKDDDGSS